MTNEAVTNEAVTDEAGTNEAVTKLSIEVNGRHTVVVAGTTVATLVAQWSLSPDGIAVARNREVVPRSAWPSTDLRADDRVEIVTAAAGG